MLEIRMAKDEDVQSQKELWKICFGDEDFYIDFYFENKYKDTKVAVGVYNNKLVAMATMMPLNIVNSEGSRENISMLYAIATHPEYQGMGFSTQIIDFCNDYLREFNHSMSILVPATDNLFDFYSRRGYRDAFYARQIELSIEEIDKQGEDLADKIAIDPISAKEYNHIRRTHLKGEKYVDYKDQDIDYQKSISKLSQADIYKLSSGENTGCMAVEKLSTGKIIIKELLMKDEFIEASLVGIMKRLNSDTCELRMPPYQGKGLGGEVKRFGMVRIYDDKNIKITNKDLGYLGIAYD